MAPSYANIFMGHLERKILDKVDKKLMSGGGTLMTCWSEGHTTSNTLLNLLVKSTTHIPEFNLMPNGPKGP